MLTATQADHYAVQFLEARALSQTLPVLSDAIGLTIADAYAIAYSLDQHRTKDGEQAIGRKLGFTNRKLWNTAPGTAIEAPMWTTLFDSTVRFLEYPFAVQSLVGALQPKLEPEIVFKLARTPSADADLVEIADCLEWMAHGIEIVVNPYGDAQVQPADSIAAFGMHGTLLVGEPRILSSASRQHLGDVLAHASVSVSCDDTLMGAGYGGSVLDSPVHAIWHLHQLLKTQTNFPRLQAGEIITSGTWTSAFAVQAGQTWSTAFSGVVLPGLAISFV